MVGPPDNTPEPSKALKKYRTTFYERRSDISDEGLRRQTRGYVRDFGRFLPKDRSLGILEIGCGCGTFLRTLSELGYTNVRGIDVSEEQIEFCHSQGIMNATRADAVDYLTSNDDGAHCVVMIDVLEHLPKPRAFDLLDRILERLEPGGRIILRVPNMSNPLNLRTRYVDATHELGFSRESLDQVLRFTGFEPETIASASGPHHNPLARLVFDFVLWRLFLIFYRRTMRLKDDPLPGKNLIAVGVKPGRDSYDREQR